MEQQQRTLVGAFCSAGLLAAATAVLSLSSTDGTAYAASHHGHGRGQRPVASGTARPTPLPRPTCPPRPTPAPGATEAPRPLPPIGGGNIGLLQGALGRALTTDEIASITAAATLRDASIQAALDAYHASVAASVSLSTANLDAKLQSVGRGHGRNLNSMLASALGRALTVDETSTLQIAAEVRDAAIQAAVETYRTSVAAAVGLSVADLDARVTTFLQTQHSGGHGGHGGPHEGTGTPTGTATPAPVPTDSGSTTGSY